MLHRPGKLGLGTAYIAGFGLALASGADVIIEMDADFSHSPSYLRPMVGLLDQYDVVVGPNALTASQLALLRDANVRVTIPVRSTSGKVLAVPVAALSSGSDGGSRVEVLRNGKVDLVPVTVGLSADGFAQVTPAGDAKLSEGDQVVVGR